MANTAVEQLACVGDLGAGLGTFGDALFQIADGEFCHAPFLITSEVTFLPRFGMPGTRDAPRPSWVEPHRQPGLRHVFLGFADRIFAEMKYRGGKHRAGMAVADALH